MAGSFDKPNVLVVDDDPFAAKLLRRFLTDAGYGVVTATNGSEALGVLLADGPPMVVTDWSMPEMDGLELCRSIRAHEAIPHAYVIVLTANDGGPERINEAFDAGADDYVVKPFQRRELLARVRAGERIVHLHETLERRNRELHRVNAEMAVAYGELRDANEKLHRLVITDELTGLVNRREALNRLAAYWASSDRHGDPLSCILLDVDRFKRFNDLHGHAVGDAVLKATAEVLQGCTRAGESVYRVGGEEFLVLCPKTAREQALVAAERLRRAVEAHPIRTPGLELRATISLGVAERAPSMKHPDDLIREADGALYAAKRAGRNAVRCAEPSRVEPAPTNPNSAAPAPTHSAATKEESGRVLVVDDDPLIRVLCRKALETAGFTVWEAPNGRIALAQLRAEPADVVIMDLNMPEMDGLECVRHIKADPLTRGIPVILATAQSHVEDVVRGLEAGADEYVSKPLNPKELVLRIRTMLRLRKELDASNEVRGEQSRALSILSEFSTGIASCESLDAILETTLSALVELTCSRRTAIFFPDAGEPFLSIAHSTGLLSMAERGVRVPLGTPTVGEVFESRVPVVINDAASAGSRAHHVDSVLFTSVPSVVWPLCAAEAVVGVAVISGRASDQPFSALDLEYVGLVCRVASAFIADCLNRQARDDANESIMIGLAKLAEHRDADTGKHLDRVTRFALLLAEDLRGVERYSQAVNDDFLRDLRRAVPLHDIGKVAVPDHILRKPGPLDAEETRIMRTHAAIGGRTLRSLVERAPGTRFLKMAEEITFGHHEWFDGRGYPAGSRGEAIPLAARIVAIADVYDALTTRRPYKEAMPHARASAIILEGSGTHFDPAVVEAFLRCEKEFERLAAELRDDAGPSAEKKVATPSAARAAASLAGSPS